jgi:hypothetical protein
MDEISKDFLDWFQEKIKGMSAEEFRNYVIGMFSEEPAEEERKFVDRVKGKHISRYLGLFDIPPDL